MAGVMKSSPFTPPAQGHSRHAPYLLSSYLKENEVAVLSASRSYLIDVRRILLYNSYYKESFSIDLKFYMTTVIVTYLLLGLEINKLKSQRICLEFML